MRDGKKNPGVLLESLAQGWSSQHTYAVDEFLRLWAEALNTETAEVTHEEDATAFRTDLSNVRFSGMGRVPCLLISGEAEQAREGTRSFWRKASKEPFISCVLCASQVAYVEATSLLPRTRAVVLARSHILQILSDDDPLAAFRKMLLRRVPLLRLIPFSISRPATGAMFFGRKQELELLLHQDQTNVIVAGPGMIGKSSLLQEFERRSSIRGERRKAVYVDCRQDETSHDLAQHLAWELQPKRKALKVDVRRLPHFLRCAVRGPSRPVTLILDEVDEVCKAEERAGYPAFKELALLATKGTARIILGGRRIALRASSDEQMPLHGRLGVIRLGPLAESAASRLLTVPFAEMDFVLREKDRILEHVLEMTGRLPHLLQWYGLRLATRAAEQRQNTVSMEDVEWLESQFETAWHFMDILMGIEDFKTRMAALVLTQRKLDDAKVPHIADLLSNVGIRFGGQTVRTVQQLCNDLVIRNVLCWENGSYSLANMALHRFSQQTGLLEEAIQECREVLSI